MTTLVRTAGMTHGTPDWQLDRMYETDTERVLEKAYAEGFDYSEQIKELEKARKDLDRVIDNLLMAEDDLIGTEHEYTYGIKIREAIHSVEGVDCDVGEIIKLLKEGA